MGGTRIGERRSLLAQLVARKRVMPLERYTRVSAIRIVTCPLAKMGQARQHWGRSRRNWHRSLRAGDSNANAHLAMERRDRRPEALRLQSAASSASVLTLRSAYLD